MDRAALRDAGFQFWSYPGVSLGAILGSSPRDDSIRSDQACMIGQLTEVT